MVYRHLVPLKYRLLVIDLDGTLLGRDGQVSERNRQAVAAAREAGLRIAVATGRALVECRHALEAVGHDGPVVAAGGSILCDARSGHTIDRSAMPATLVTAITRSLVRHGHKALILKDGHATGYDYLAVGPNALDPASAWWFRSLSVRVRYADEPGLDEHPHDSVRAGTVARSAALGTIAAELRQDLGDRVFIQHWSAVTQSEATGSQTHLLEAFNPSVNKWTMIASYCRRADIATSEVAAIGDEINDLEMIRQAGLGVAMGNAVACVKAAAARVTAGHDADGLARAVDHILAGRW